MPTRRVVASPLASRVAPKQDWSRLYNSRAWKAASRRFLAEHLLCITCEREGRSSLATQTDHIRPHRGDLRLFWDATNWQPLCQSCHSRKTARGE